MIADSIGMKNAEGALVARLDPAAKGGVKIGDVIISVNNEAVKDTRDLVRRIAATAPGIAFMRRGARN
jgi:serine protease Do